MIPKTPAKPKIKKILKSCEEAANVEHRENRLQLTMENIKENFQKSKKKTLYKEALTKEKMTTQTKVKIEKKY